MSIQHPNIVYVGDLEQGQSLAAAVSRLNWGVYIPQDAREALGMVITYLPDVIILDMVARPTVAAEAYYHLRTMTGEPVKLIVLSLDPGEPDDDVVMLPYGASREAIIAAVTELMQTSLAF